MKTLLMIVVLCAAVLLPTCASAVPDHDRVLFYYGYPSSFNYHVNGWDPTRVAQDMSRYNMVVLGAGIEHPAHLDHNNTVTIISQLPSTAVYGYVTLNQHEAAVCAEIDQWNDMGVAGIFLDEAGYDFGTGRAVFNRIVNHIHTRSSADAVFVNAWNPDHVLGTADDVSYPNSIYNPEMEPSSIIAGDYYLLESCPIHNNRFRMSEYDVAKCNKCVAHRSEHGVSLASVSTIWNRHPTGWILHHRHAMVADSFSFDAHGTSDLWYGALSSQVRMWR